jgi:hypothetical protein
VTGERCGAPAVTSFTIRSGHVLYECADHAPAAGQTVPSPAVVQIKHARGKLTKHQAEVFSRLRGRSRSGWSGDRQVRWVAAEAIGSRTALKHLVRKGWAEEKVEYGPRGGERLSYRPVA